MRVALTGAALAAGFLLVGATSAAQLRVASELRIDDSKGGFSGEIDDFDMFGTSIASLGDLDGDGVGDIAVGATFDNDGGVNRGAVWILFLNADGTVKGHQKISDTEGSFGGVLDDGDYFGASVTALNDLDGDSVCDLAVGAIFDDDGGSGRGAIWILFLNADGTVKSEQKISQTAGGFGGSLDNGGRFGISAAAGDLDQDGVADLAVGAPLTDGTFPVMGAVFVLFLNADGTVKAHQEISDLEGGFAGALGLADEFGAAVVPLGDLDGDGVGDIAASAPGDDDGGTDRGAVWILFLNVDGTVKSHQKISDDEGGLATDLDNGDRFGSSLAQLGDIEEGGTTDLGVGASDDDDGGPKRGAVYVLHLLDDGTVSGELKISQTTGCFGGGLENGDSFGLSLSALGDHDGNGVRDIAVGAPLSASGGLERGALWLLFLANEAFVASATVRNGNGTNALCYSSVSDPALGTMWMTEVDASAHVDAGLTFVLGYDLPFAGADTPFGELLIANEVLGGNPLLVSVVDSAGGVAMHSNAIPDDVCLSGLEVFTQAVILGGIPELCNAIDLVLGE